MPKVRKGTVILFFVLLAILSFPMYHVLGASSVGVGADNVGLTIGEYEAPKTVYAQQYVYLNWTISDNNAGAVLKNSTLELSNGVIIVYDNATATFSEAQDTGDYFTLDTFGSLHTELNTTALRLSARIMFSWNYPKGNISIVSANAYDSLGEIGEGSKTDWFYFENDLIVGPAIVNHDRVDPKGELTFTGTVHYEGTTIPPASGNSALSLDGIDDYVNCGNVLNLDYPFSVSFWMNTTNPTKASQTMVAKYQGPPYYYGYEIRFEGSSGKLIFDVNQPGGTGGKTSTAILSASTWYFIVGTYDGNYVRLYINGQEDRNRVAYNQHLTQWGSNFYIGRRDDGLNFNGSIDEVSVYNRVLSDTEISECYQGVYSNESGRILYLPFDGNTVDQSGQGNNVTNYGAEWASGVYVNINVKVELNGELKQTVDKINAANGSFTLPNVIAPINVGNYKYKIYVVTNRNIIQNQTLNVIVDRLKIIDSGVSQSSCSIGDTVTVWSKAVYEFDNSPFDETTGLLYLNGTVMNWSTSNQRWELKYVTNSTGQNMFKITSVLDKKYNLTNVNDVAGPQTVTVSSTWYYPIVSWFNSVPLIAWESATIVSILAISIAVLFRLGILTVKIEKLLTPEEELDRKIDELLQPFTEKDEQLISLQHFLHQLLEKNPPPETIEFLKKYLPIIIKESTERKEKKDDKNVNVL
jgi:hypothetical protein